MAPILMERGQNFVERDIDECLWTPANLLVGGVADDPVDPGSEGRVTPERIDLPHHVPDRILAALLGILLVTRDSDRQAIRAVAVRRNELLDGGRLAQTQCFDEPPVTINSRRTGAGTSHAASDGVPLTAIAIRSGGRFGARGHRAGRHPQILRPCVVSPTERCARTGPVLPRPEKSHDQRRFWPRPMNHVTAISRA